MERDEEIKTQIICAETFLSGLIIEKEYYEK